MRPTLIATALLGLAACSPAIPDSAAGVGVTSPSAQSASQVPAPPQVNQAPLATTPLASTPAAPAQTATGQATGQTSATAGAIEVFPQNQAAQSARPAQLAQPLAGQQAQTSEEIAAETRATLQAAQANSGRVPLEANPNNPPPQTVTRPGGISKENDFNAVDSVRSIEGDAEFIAQNRAQYQVVQPTALPPRDNSGPNIVSYALSTSHPVGTKVWNRIGINMAARAQRNCAQFASPDLAQAEFLSKGGPQRDRLGLDPDGDGYACGWNPAPFRAAVRG
jgi:hypothetical protein